MRWSARFDRALAGMDGDEELLAYAARAAIPAFARSRERLAQQRAAGDFGAIAQEAHKLIPGWSLFAPRGKTRIARALEQAALEGRVARVAPLLARLIEQLALVEAELREWQASSSETAPGAAALPVAPSGTARDAASARDQGASNAHVAGETRQACQGCSAAETPRHRSGARRLRNR